MKPRRIAALRVLLETVRGDGTYELRHRLGALPRLFRSASSGSYRGWDSRRVLGLFGLADDALVAAWLAGAVLAEVDGFLDWEKAEQKVVRGDVLR